MHGDEVTIEIVRQAVEEIEPGAPFDEKSAEHVIKYARRVHEYQSDGNFDDVFDSQRLHDLYALANGFRMLEE